MALWLVRPEGKILVAETASRRAQATDGLGPGSKPTDSPVAMEGPSVTSEEGGEAPAGRLREPHVGVDFGSRGRGCQRLQPAARIHSAMNPGSFAGATFAESIIA
jgi:hypothetical protein